MNKSPLLSATTSIFQYFQPIQSVMGLGSLSGVLYENSAIIFYTLYEPNL